MTPILFMCQWANWKVWHDGVENALNWESKDIDSSQGFATKHLENLLSLWVQFPHLLNKELG